MWDLLRRLFESLLAIVLVVVLIGLVEVVINVDIARILLGTKPSDAEVIALKRQLGVDQPFAIRIFNRVGRAFKGDLGQSYVFRQPVTQLISSSFTNSIWLIIPAIFFGVGIGIPLGILCAYYSNKAVEAFLAALSAFALLPSVILSSIAVYYLSYELSLLKTSYLGAVVLLCLPPLLVTTLTIYQEYVRILKNDCTRAMRSFGFSEWLIALRYSLKLAAIGLIANVTYIALYLLTATVFIEINFSLPGLGSLLLMAVERFDFPVISGISLIVVVCFGIVNTLSGIGLYATDPRTR
jgi:peptide/nickel transport system permease protein